MFNQFVGLFYADLSALPYVFLFNDNSPDSACIPQIA